MNRWKITATAMLIPFLVVGCGTDSPLSGPSADHHQAPSDVAASASSHGAMSGVLVNERFTTPFVLGDPPTPPTNPCTGEVMTGTIDWHVVVRDVDASGEMVEYHMSARVEARGRTTGTRYHGTATYNRIVNGSAGAAHTLTHRVRGGLISHGAADDWFTTLLVHTTVNADGGLTAFRAVVDGIQCRG